MTVRAVRARVPAPHGLVHRHDCQGDCCQFDRLTDELATGEDIYSSDVEVPAGSGLRRFRHLLPTVGAQTLRAGEPSGHTSS